MQLGLLPNESRGSRWCASQAAQQRERSQALSVVHFASLSLLHEHEKLSLEALTHGAATNAST